MVVGLFSMLRIPYSFLLLEVYLCTIKLEMPIDTTIEFVPSSGGIFVYN